jgi:excisionase family DNA binding protein
MPEMMTVEQVAKYLQMDEQTVYRLTRRGAIPSAKIGHQWRYNKEILDKWFVDQITEHQNEQAAPKPKAKKEATPNESKKAAKRLEKIEKK